MIGWNLRAMRSLDIRIVVRIVFILGMLLGRISCVGFEEGGLWDECES